MWGDLDNNYTLWIHLILVWSPLLLVAQLRRTEPHLVLLQLRRHTAHRLRADITWRREVVGGGVSR